MKTYESEETYLETIFILERQGGGARSVDIANELGYSRPSISAAMKNLRGKGYIKTDSAGYIKLTPGGREIAEAMYERHTIISDWLVYLGVDEKTAANDACRMEHAMSAESFAAIKKHIENINNN
ncbi:MAG: metal-dependent transcriptional regulator [Oscillospiraceae bacterium]|nr:metal-dependent transcriptional regulator [Oscillospiraceae bacterium]